jgi:hypothetical protein
MRISFRSVQRVRKALRFAIVGVVGTGLFVGAGAIAQTPSPQFTFTMRKDAFGIAPGAGFFLNPPVLARGLSDYKTLGVRWIRSTIPWKNFQPRDPATLAPSAAKYNWKSVDGFVATMHSPSYAGLFNLIITIESPPEWAAQPARIAPIACGGQAPFDLQSYADASAALAQHLQGTASVFELENSPNISPVGTSRGFWAEPNPCGYTQLLKRSYPAIKAVRPDATVLVGGIGGVQDKPGERMPADTYLAGLYAYGARGSFDGVSYHPYSRPNLPCSSTDPICVFNPDPSRKDPYGMKNGWNRMLNAHNIMAANGEGTKKIWMTEYGAATTGRTDSYRVVTEAEQATLLAAGYARNSQYTWAGPLCWFTYQDEGVNPETDQGGDWMGLVRKDYSRKPAFGMYRGLTRLAI